MTMPAPQQLQDLRRAVDRHVAEHRLVPPLTLDELRHHADTVQNRCNAAEPLGDLLMVLVSNAVWRDTVASIPFERRVLLLPQCLRHRARCRAEVDEFGLLCEECGACSIGRLQHEAEQLGYVVLVAEGTTVVIRLIEQGRVDAVIGVSCLAVLERAFPHMAAEAVPGVAVPLLRDGCDETAVDEAWVRELIRLRSPHGWRERVDPEELRRQVDSWCSPEALHDLLAPSGRTATIAVDWLATGGKRWRPLLCACACRALGCDGPAETLRKVAVAVECFHKASLIHDDIEDGDRKRYGRPTVHAQHGIPVALNVGDLLLGEGYRLIGDCGAPPEQIAAMLRVAAWGHRELALGQGAELCWRAERPPMRSEDILAIFRSKTAPAFSVALETGAIVAGGDAETCRVLRRFSTALGAAYQIHDDLEDQDDNHLAPSLLDALAREAAPRPQGAADKARQLFEFHKNEALRALSPLRCADLKNLLHRVTRRILSH